MASVNMRRLLLSAVAAAVGIGAALAGLAGFAGVGPWRDVPFLESSYLALRKARRAAGRVAGPPLRRWLVGSGRPATEIYLYDPVGLAEDAHGNLYFADRGDGQLMGLAVGHFIWRIGSDGHAEVIAGTGIEGTPRDGAPALAADLGAPASIAIGRDGRLHFADPRNHVVMRIEADGRLTRVAGTGDRATAATLALPRSISPMTWHSTAPATCTSPTT